MGLRNATHSKHHQLAPTKHANTQTHTFIHMHTHTHTTADTICECPENIALAAAANAAKVLVDLCKDKSLIVHQYAAAALAELASHSTETRQAIVHNVSVCVCMYMHMHSCLNVYVNVP